MSQIVTTPDGKRHKFPDGASQDQIKTALASYVPRGASPAPVATMTATNNPAASRMAGMKDRALKLLPDVGGAVGGVVGGVAGAVATAPVGGGGAIPGAMVGAAVGGGAGEALRQNVSGEPFSGREIEKAAGTQGLYEGAGGALAKGASKLARPLMQKALGSVSSLARRFKTTPEAIAHIVLDADLPISEAGATTAREMGRMVRNERGARIAAVGSSIGSKTLAQAAIEESEKNLGRRMTRAERAVVVRQVEDEANAILTNMTHGAVPKAKPGTPAIPAQPASTTLDQWGQPMRPATPATPAGAKPPSRFSAPETEQIKEVAAKNARPEYRASQAAASVSADPALSKQIAAAARSRLNKIPGVKADNVRIKNMMVAEQAITNAVEHGSVELTPILVAAGVKLPRNVLNKLSRVLNSPKFQAIARQSPRAAGAMIAQLMHTDAEPKARKVAALRAGAAADSTAGGP